MAKTDAGRVTVPARGSRGRRILAVAVAGYLAAVLVVWALLRFYADVWWPATLVLFGPRWMCALPLAVLAPLAAWRDRRLLVPLAVAAAVIALPILDYRVAFPGRATAAPTEPTATPPRHVRVMTYNIGGDPNKAAGLDRILAEVAPDIVAIQECTGTDLVAAIPRGERYLVADGDVCLVSRSKIDRAGVQDPDSIAATGGTGAMVRYTVHLPAGDVQLVNLHLATVRDGLSAVMHGRLRGVPALEENIAIRRAVSAMARAFVDAAPPPFLVAGDFNLPTDSAIYRRDWASFTNAFDAAGEGFGATKETRWFGVRIDHILLGPGWACERAFVGPHLTGDHRPVVADLTWSG